MRQTTNQTRRSMRGNHLVIRIRFQNEIAGNIIDAEDYLVPYQRENIEQAFKRYTTRNNIKIYDNKTKVFFLIRGDKHILLDNGRQIRDLHLNQGDIIEVQSPDINLYFGRVILNNSRSKIIKVIITISVVVLIILGILLLFFCL